jgi:hypothetical protein
MLRLPGRQGKRLAPKGKRAGGKTGEKPMKQVEHG